MGKRNWNLAERFLYNPENERQMVDWMGYEIGYENNLCHDFSKDIPDTAVLTQSSYNKLSRVRKEDEELYNNWLSLFVIIDKTVMDPLPDDTIWDCVRQLQFLTDATLEVEKEIPKRVGI